MHLKAKLLAIASALAVATTTTVVTAPIAHASPIPVGSCTGQVWLHTFTPALTDQTQSNVTEKLRLALDQTTHQYIGGSCSDIAATNDVHIPPPSGPMTPKAATLLMHGNLSCARFSTAQAADLQAADTWYANGKMTYSMNETYTDLLTGLIRNYKIPAYVTVVADPVSIDGYDVTGIVTNGALSPGATVSGTIWADPVTKLLSSDENWPGAYNTGYQLDITSAAGCADDQQSNVNISTMLSGGGGTSQESLLGSTDSAGLSFSVGM